jgi:hypothetical protein
VTAAVGPPPRDEPLTYPGVAPDASGLVTADGFRRPAGAPWPAPSVDDALRARGAARLAERTPVLAVGSNASPAQLLAKFRGTAASPVVPLTWASATGVRVGVAAFVSRWGYVPAAPVFERGATSRLAVIWLDDDQLAVVDTTEGGYERRVMHAGDGRGCTVRLESGELVGECGIYVSRTGVLADAADGAPLALLSQRALVLRLLAAADPALAELTGGTAEGFVATARDPDTRSGLVAMLRSAPGLRVLP